MLGKMLNISPDIGNKPIRNFNALRSLSGGDPVTGRELYKNGFDFINQAKLIISCNDVPDFDNVQASYNRINIIHCDHVFTAEDTKNFNYDDYGNEEEMSGLINEGLRAYKNTVERGGFNKPDSEDTADEHNFLVNNMNTHQAFLRKSRKTY